MDVFFRIGLPGGSSPRPPFSRFARRAVECRPPSLLWSWYIQLWSHQGKLVQTIRWFFAEACTVLETLRASWFSTRDGGPSEARKRGSGGGSPRKSDDPPTGPSDLARREFRPEYNNLWNNRFYETGPYVSFLDIDKYGKGPFARKPVISILKFTTEMIGLEGEK
jgi:hypothetical protein